MTDESCIAYCTKNGYIYAGTEYSSQCCKFLGFATFEISADHNLQIVATLSLQAQPLLRLPIARWVVQVTPLKLAVARAV